MDIGKIIKEERTKRNLTQEQLAQEFFCHSATDFKMGKRQELS